jgi:hypothetical protein
MYVMVLSKVVIAIPFLGNGVGGRMSNAPHYNIFTDEGIINKVMKPSYTRRKLEIDDTKQ